MPPKRQPSKRGSAKTAAPVEEPPPSSEDAKPNVDALNADDDTELPSDPLTVEPEPIPAPSTSENEAPIAPPARRLDTLNKSGLGSPSTRGKKAVAAPKRAVRRSQASREELLRAENERRKAEEARTAEEAAKARREPTRQDVGRGSGRARGRGRGGYMGESARREPVASGPFSAGQVSKEVQKKNRGWSDKNSGWNGIRVPKPKSTAGAEKPAARSTRTQATKPTTTVDWDAVQAGAGPSNDVKPVLDANGDISMAEPQEVNYIDGGIISSDEEDEKGGVRMNVEDLAVIDLTQDEAEINPFAPVRVARVAHKERSMGINADGATNQEGAVAVDANDIAAMSASEKRKGKQRAKDVEVIGEKKGFQAVYSDSESDREPEPRIKEEVEEDVRLGTPEPREIGVDVPFSNASSSPESKRKAKEKAKVRAPSSESLPDMPEYQTREDIEEWERHQQDLQIIRSELGRPVAAADGDGDATMTDAQVDDQRADKVYLFQFPPVLPDLVPIRVKPDPDAIGGETNGTDPMAIDPPNNPNKPITIQDDARPDIHQPKLPSGAIGKLKVHASGRVTLDWGGTTLSLGMGTEASFLQDVLVASLPEQKSVEVDGVDVADVGQAFSMGQVKGKFVVTPDWEELLR